MRVFARSLLLVVAAELALASAAAAQTGIYLPQAPMGPGGEDTIETGTGTRCQANRAQRPRSTGWLALTVNR